MAGNGSDGGLGRVLRLAPDCDPKSLHMDPMEGFLLSRIDGNTPWRVLREMGAMTAEEVDLVLEGWLARGLLEIDEEKSSRDRERRRIAARETREQRKVASQPVIPNVVDEAAIDPELDIPVETQRTILEFETRLGGRYHEILDVAPDADAKQIKRAYFKLSKDYHPDRYFRRQIGSYAGRLDRIFKKITEAYELLSDPMTRAEIEKSMHAAGPAPQAAAGGGDQPGRAVPSRPLTPIERLRQRMPIRLPAGMLKERRDKAAAFFDAAKVAERRGRFMEAASSVRLAIAFDPFNEVYKQRFGEVRAKAAEMRAAQLLENTEAYETGHVKEALRLFEEVLLYRPHDPEINDKAAGLAIELNEFAKAEEYIGRAIEHSPDIGRYHRTLAKLHLARNEKGHAVHELERTLKLDSGDQEAARLLASLKTRRGQARGGTR